MDLLGKTTHTHFTDLAEFSTTLGCIQVKNKLWETPRLKPSLWHGSQMGNPVMQSQPHAETEEMENAVDHFEFLWERKAGYKGSK